MTSPVQDLWQRPASTCVLAEDGANVYTDALKTRLPLPPLEMIAGDDGGQ